MIIPLDSKQFINIFSRQNNLHLQFTAPVRKKSKAVIDEDLNLSDDISVGVVAGSRCPLS